jgi:ABC-type uncharacterized transport system substrate-binding protein
MADKKEEAHLLTGMTEKKEEKKTDEEKEYPENTVFVCVEDCYFNKIRYRKGNTITGKKCPEHFKAQGAEEGNKK